jgi:hypothetical protein
MWCLQRNRVVGRAGGGLTVAVDAALGLRVMAAVRAEQLLFKK